MSRPTRDPYFPLGTPDPDDIESAARLLVEYQRKGLTGPEFGEMFYRMVRDPKAVVARAEELTRIGLEGVTDDELRARLGIGRGPPCPSCGGGHPLAIIMGRPGAPELFEASRRGLVELGGCILEGSDPEWRCTSCNHAFRTDEVRVSELDQARAHAILRDLKKRGRL